MRVYSEMARDQAHQHTNFQVVGGYLSPVSDDYKKPGLAPGEHRNNMCRLACAKSSNWLMVDDWEVRQPAYSKTADVLDHFNVELNDKLGGVQLESLDPDTDEVVFSQERRKVRIMLLAGSDLIQTMSEPGVWDGKDVKPQYHSQYGAAIDPEPIFFSSTTFSATLAASSSSVRNPKSTSLSSPPLLSILALLSLCTATTSSWSRKWSATTFLQPKSASSSAAT